MQRRMPGDLYQGPTLLLRSATIGLVLLLAWSCAASSAVAESRSHVNTDQAALHIQATIMPVVLKPHLRGEDQPQLAVSYSFPGSDVQLSVTEEFHHCSLECEGEHAAKGDALLHTTIVVAK